MSASYVNLKHFSEFNKYTMTLGGAIFVYFDQFAEASRDQKAAGVILSAVVVLLGVVIMSAAGRIKGDDIDYKVETEPNKLLLFKIVSRALVLQLVFLAVVVALAGFVGLKKILA